MHLLHSHVVDLPPSKPSEAFFKVGQECDSGEPTDGHLAIGTTAIDTDGLMICPHYNRSIFELSRFRGFRSALIEGDTREGIESRQ